MHKFRFCGQLLSSPEPNLFKVSFCDDLSQQMLKRTSKNICGYYIVAFKVVERFQFQAELWSACQLEGKLIFLPRTTVQYISNAMFVVHE